MGSGRVVWLTHQIKRVEVESGRSTTWAGCSRNEGHRPRGSHSPWLSHRRGHCFSSDHTGGRTGDCAVPWCQPVHDALSEALRFIVLGRWGSHDHKGTYPSIKTTKQQHQSLNSRATDTEQQKKESHSITESTVTGHKQFELQVCGPRRLADPQRVGSPTACG